MRPRKRASMAKHLVSVTIECRVAPIGSDLYVGMTTIGGLQVRGRSAKEPDLALKNLFFALQDGNNDDVNIAIARACQGQTLSGIMELPVGEPSPE